jgi:hypothetical protein
MDRDSYKAACEASRAAIAKLFAKVEPTPTDAWVAEQTDALMRRYEDLGDTLDFPDAVERP